MRHGFKDVMFASNHLYEEEQKLERVARRLKEQNEYALFPHTLSTKDPSRG